MAIAASLIVNVGADTSKFGAGMRKVRAGAKDSESAMAKLGGAAKSAFGAFAAGFAVSKLVSFVRASDELIDSTAKLSDRLGLSVESLTGLQLQANLAGVAAEDLTKGLEHLQRTVGLADGASVEYARGLQMLGLEANDLRNLPLDQQLVKVAERMDGLKNQSDKAAVAFTIFGRAGQGLMSLLENPRGLAAARGEAERLGATFSRLDAAKIEAQNDAWTRVWTSLRGIANTLEITVATADNLNAAANKVGGLNSNLQKTQALYGQLREEGASPVEAYAALALNSLGIKGGYQTDLENAARHYLRAQQAAEAKAAADLKAKNAQQQSAVASQALGEKIRATREAMDLETASLHGHAATEKIDVLLRNQNATAIQRQELMLLRKQALDNEAEKKAQTLQKSIDQTTESLRAQAAVFGISGASADLYKLRLQGATDAQLAQAEKLQHDLERAGKVKSIMEQSLSPLEKAKKDVAELNDLFATGWLTNEFYGRSLAKISDELQQVAALSEIKLPGAAGAESREAYSTIARTQANGSSDPAARLAQALDALARRDEIAQRQRAELIKAFQEPRFNVLSGK